MKRFKYQCKTQLIFGKGSVSQLGKLIDKKYKKILLHYGGGSIKQYGLYQEIVEILKEEDLQVFELAGVEPNPKLSMVRKGIEICKEEGIDIILAVGGGSAIDSAKAIGIGAKYDGDVWDFFTGKATVKDSLEVGVILTLPATGSESSTGSVITNEDGLYKRAVDHNLMRPSFAIMDPQLSLTLPDSQTFPGIMDILSHVFERYFTNTEDVDLIDQMSEGVMKSIIKNAYILKNNRDDYAARAEIMLAGTIAHNGLLGLGRDEDWASHNIGHEMSALYGTTHGTSLAIIFPAWMKYVYRSNLDVFAQFASRVFNVDSEGKNKDQIALEGIEKFESFLQDMDLPTTFSQAKIPTDAFEEMAEKATENGPQGSFMKLDREDIVKIYELAK